MTKQEEFYTEVNKIAEAFLKKYPSSNKKMVYDKAEDIVRDRDKSTLQPRDLNKL